jgi:predicted alpha/beta hydrolase family esterase
MTNNFIIPGLGNSGPEHWQTYFENSAENFLRINQQEWDAPVYLPCRVLKKQPSKAMSRPAVFYIK